MDAQTLIEIGHLQQLVLLISHENINFYSLYRWAMLGITLFNVFNVVVSILKYKRYFDRLPLFLQRYFQEKTKKILGNKLNDSHREIQINLGLLGILITLNIVLFFI
ncbi:hypothetical protein Lepto7376_3898 [[Leptolyngbya] sp. PCC 7376]|uniref:hypothetical protein n=1 Tax=[Leptolyngbya] sp. PCC 7376 TaxID=111781 RepID=UPI00029ED1F8|nr:hypothetical protein [[Leptolyngbya] sp. PCC 7376]AFY40051.1 hypothetical protein Lepto7376_3898 [[Leptolyngbya] sp. PCC 7376]